MKIVFSIDDLLHKLFPETDSGNANIEKTLTEFYTIDSAIPKIQVNEKFVTVELDTSQIIREQDGAKKVVGLCEAGKFREALPLAISMTENYPTISENHRILGQIYSELGEYEESIDCLIDALRWNPKNEYALIMMGNVFAREKQDIDTALVYYNEVIANNPEESLAYNNIGANLMQLGRTDEAKGYFQKALSIDQDYPNTHIGLAMVLESEGNDSLAFEHVLKAIRKSRKGSEIYKNGISLSGEMAVRSSESDRVKGIIDKYVFDLEKLYGFEIRKEVSDEIPTAAKLELKENHDRDYHLIRYQSKYPTYPHLIIHELVHLELAEEAREQNENQLFISNPSHRSKFFISLEKHAKKLDRDGYSDSSISSYLEALHMGMNRQIFNTPIDLFIEDRIYDRFPDLRAVQFYSLFVMISEGIDAVTRKEIVDRSPRRIISKSKIYNLVNTFHFKGLFGIDLTKEHNPSKIEIDTATRLYGEFLEYREDKEAGEEYELVRHWAEDLKLDGYFDLISESKYRNQSIEEVLDEVNKDPLNLDEKNSSNEREMRTFIEQHSTENINYAVAMYMMGALEFFDKLNHERIKKIAFEFATLGMGGINPEKDNYSIPELPQMNFTGYKALAYYYSSWAIALPEMLGQLNMPFDKEFKMAKSFVNTKG